MDFIKAQGLGNDFVMIINTDVLPSELSNLSRKVADRRYGIGCDQVIVTQTIENRTKVRFFNSDGSEAESCGNGSRCIAKHLMQQGNTDSIVMETMGGTLNCFLDNKGMVSIEMPSPVFEVFDGPQGLGHLSTPDAVSVVVGNPHLVCFVDDISLVERYGEGLENHPAFPLRTNVDFVKIINPEHIELKVWERGTGITPACGSGACASMVASFVHKKVNSHVKVSQAGGDLWVSFDGKKLLMTGEATIVFTGSIDV